MPEPRRQYELWHLLRQATVLLSDPNNPAHWGTGFFIANDVLLTCWHVVRDVAGPCLLVERPEGDLTAAGPMAFLKLGAATLLEAGQPWDLALLRFTPDGDGTPTGSGVIPVVVPLQELDPPPGASLLTTAFPVNAASRHDATYEAAGRTTPAGEGLEFLRFKADGVVPGFSGSALMDQDTRRGCGVVARNALPGGASDGGMAVPLAAFREAFPENGEEVLGRNATERHPGFTSPQKRMVRVDWSWPVPLDSGHPKRGTYCVNLQRQHHLPVGSKQRGMHRCPE